MESFSFLVMVPSFSKKTKKTTINYQEIANVNTFPCLNDLMYAKMDKEALVNILEAEELNNLA